METFGCSECDDDMTEAEVKSQKEEGYTPEEFICDECMQNYV